MQRRDFLQTTLLSLPALAARPSTAPAKPLRALFVTDMHLSPRMDKAKAAADFLVGYLHKNPSIQLVINGGDTIYDVAKLAYPAGEYLWEYWHSIRSQIGIPVYSCIGNHDIYNWELSTEALARPQDEKRSAMKHLGMDNSYYAFTAGRWKFIMLDSLTYVLKGYKGALDPEQMSWLATELDNDRDLRLAIISHIPVLTACATLYLNPEKAYLYPKISERLSHTDAPAVFDVLKSRPADLFLHGHLHMQETIAYKGSTIYNGGALCADMWRGPFHDFNSCFTIIDLPAEGPPVMQRIDLPKS